MHTPAAMDAAAAATHGPGAPGVVERLVAARSPSLDVPLPALYVFGPEAEYLSHPARAPDVLSADPVFETLREQAYWGEVVDDRFYWVPWLGQCEIADVLGRPVAMRAPKGGLLFLQFLKPDCTQCRDATAAIERLIVARPDLPVRWVQVEVPARLRRPKE